MHCKYIHCSKSNFSLCPNSNVLPLHFGHFIAARSAQGFIKLSTVSLLIVSIALNLLVRPLIALVIFGWCAPMVFLGTNRYCFTNAISCVSSIIALFSNSGIEQRLNLYLLAIVVILRGLSVRIQNSIELLIWK